MGILETLLKNKDTVCPITHMGDGDNSRGNPYTITTVDHGEEVKKKHRHEMGDTKS